MGIAFHSISQRRVAIVSCCRIQVWDTVVLLVSGIYHIRQMLEGRALSIIGYRLLASLARHLVLPLIYD